MSSKVYEPKKKTGIQYQENNYNYNNYKQYYQPQKNIVRPNSAFVNTKNNIKPPIMNNQYQNNNKINEMEIFGITESKKPSMFEKYYKEQLDNKNNDNNDKDYNINPNYYNDIKKNNNINYNQEEENENENAEMNENLNPMTKPPKDYIESNKHLISKIQEANNSNRLKEYYEKKENPFHKEYGKTPKYIENMRKETEKKKELEKLRKETAKYPKGTRLLSEEERITTLEKLKQSKEDINKVIEKLPITCDSQAFRNKKEELFKKLDEIENAIETFSKKKVFVKIEEN